MADPRALINFQSMLPESAIFLADIPAGNLVHPAACSHGDDIDALKNVTTCPICRAASPPDKLLRVDLHGVIVLKPATVEAAKAKFKELETKSAADAHKLKELEAQQAEAKAKTAELELQIKALKLAFVANGESPKQEVKEATSSSALPPRRSFQSKFTILLALEKAQKVCQAKLLAIVTEKVLLQHSIRVLQEKMKTSLHRFRLASNIEEKESKDRFRVNQEALLKLAKTACDKPFPAIEIVNLVKTITEEELKHKKQQHQLKGVFGPLFVDISKRYALLKEKNDLEKELESNKKELDTLQQGEQMELDKVRTARQPFISKSSTTAVVRTALPVVIDERKEGQAVRPVAIAMATPLPEEGKEEKRVGDTSWDDKLQVAILARDFNAVQTALLNKANPNLRISWDEREEGKPADKKEAFVLTPILVFMIKKPISAQELENARNIANLLIQAMPSECINQICATEDYTALHMAAYIGDPALVEALLKRNANRSALNKRGRTPQQEYDFVHKNPDSTAAAVMQVAFATSAEVVSKALATPAPKAEEKKEEKKSDMTLHLNSRLRTAVYNEDVSGVQSALANGSDANYFISFKTPQYDSSHEGSPLIYVLWKIDRVKGNSMTGDLNKLRDIALLLIPRTILDKKYFDDDTALHWAAYSKELALVIALKKHGANEPTRNKYGRLPMDEYTRGFPKPTSIQLAEMTAALATPRDVVMVAGLRR